MKHAFRLERGVSLVKWAMGWLIVYASNALASDWPSYRGPKHDGISTDRIQKQWPTSGPREVWRVPLSNGFSSFAVSQGKALTLVSRSLGGTNQEVCMALNADTGAELWATPIGPAYYPDGGAGAGDGPRSTPTVDGDRVYVLSAWLSLACLNLTNGQVVWTKDLRQDYGGSMILYQNGASPLLEGNLIYVNCNNTNPAAAQTLLALHKSDGSLAWKGQTNQMTHATPVVATIGGVRQVIFFTQPGLIAVEPQTGAVFWRYAFPYAVSSGASPVVAGDIVVCTSAYPVAGAGAVRIDRSNNVFTAAQIWRVTPATLGAQWCTPVYHNGFLYGLFARHGYTIYLKCADVATGAIRWSRSASGSGTAFGMGNVVMVDGVLLVQGATGELVLVESNPADYVEIACAQVLSGKCWSSPAISNGRIYARSTTEGVCLDVAVPALKMLAPQRGTGTQIQLLVSTADGSALSSDRLTRIQMYSTTDLAVGLTNWTRLTNSLTPTNGLGRLDMEDNTQPQRYFIATELP